MVSPGKRKDQQDAANEAHAKRFIEGHIMQPFELLFLLSTCLLCS